MTILRQAVLAMIVNNIGCREEVDVDELGSLLRVGRGYDQDKCPRPLHEAGIATEIARRGEPHGSGLGKTRWIVKRTISWLHNFRRLCIRFERLGFIHEAFMRIACSIIRWRIEFPCLDSGQLILISDPADFIGIFAYGAETVFFHSFNHRILSKGLRRQLESNRVGIDSADLA